MQPESRLEVKIMLINAVGRVLPEKVGNYDVKPYQGVSSEDLGMPKVVSNRRPTLRPPSGSKVLDHWRK